MNIIIFHKVTLFCVHNIKRKMSLYLYEGKKYSGTDTEEIKMLGVKIITFFKGKSYFVHISDAVVRLQKAAAL